MGKGGVRGPSSHYNSEVGQKTRAAMLRTLVSLSLVLSFLIKIHEQTALIHAVEVHVSVP